MSILVVGSVAFDNIKTPFGKAERCLGGSATYFSVAASFFTDVELVAVIGDDFSQKEMEIFRGRRINLDGLERVQGKTFAWSGEYGYDLNVAKTLDTRLNVFMAMFRAVFASVTSCRRPSFFRSTSFNACTPNETRLTPAAL